MVEIITKSKTGDDQEFTGLDLDLQLQLLPRLEAEAPMLFADLPGETIEPPEELNPLIWTQIEYQKMSDCTAHDGTTVAENVFLFTTGRGIQFSPRHLYIRTQQKDGINGDNGSSIYNSVKVMMEIGCCPIADCPYVTPYSAARQLPAGVDEKAAPFKIASYLMIRSYDEAIAFLKTLKGAITHGTIMGFTPNAEGVVETYRPGNGGHAMAYTGWSKRKDAQGRNYLFNQNSWSKSWGKGGIAEISPAAVDATFKSKYTVAVGCYGISHPDLASPDYSKYLLT